VNRSAGGRRTNMLGDLIPLADAEDRGAAEEAQLVIAAYWSTSVAMVTPDLGSRLLVTVPGSLPRSTYACGPVLTAGWK